MVNLIMKMITAIGITQFSSSSPVPGVATSPLYRSRAATNRLHTPIRMIATPHAALSTRLIFLNVGMLLPLALIAVTGFVGGPDVDAWLYDWAVPGVGVFLGVFILVLVPVAPFTEQFARQTTPRAYWASPTLKKINRMLSAAWGVAIVAVGASRVAAAVIGRGTSHRLPDLLLGTALPIVIVVYMLKFSKSYPDRITQGEVGAHAVS